MASNERHTWEEGRAAKTHTHEAFTTMGHAQEAVTGVSVEEDYRDTNKGRQWVLRMLKELTTQEKGRLATLQSEEWNVQSH